MQAYQYRIVYPRALFIVVGWYPSEWWIGDEAAQADLMTRYGCTGEQRASVVDYMLSARKSGRLFTDASAVADSGIVRSTCT